MQIEINDRLYNDFVIWAKANNMNDNDIQKYIEKAFRDKFTLDKYGDLNDKIVEVKTEEKKPKRATKPKNEGVSEVVNEGVNDNEQISEQINELINEPLNEPEKPKRKTKVIQSK